MSLIGTTPRAVQDACQSNGYQELSPLYYNISQSFIPSSENALFGEGFETGRIVSQLLPNGP